MVVSITGATGFIGRKLVQRLAEGEHLGKLNVLNISKKCCHVHLYLFLIAFSYLFQQSFSYSLYATARSD